MALDFDQLDQLLADKRLRLVTTVGLQGFVDLDGNPGALVAELFRLGRIGQRLEKTAKAAAGGARPIDLEGIARIVDPAAFDPGVYMDHQTRASSITEAMDKAVRLQRAIFNMPAEAAVQ